MRVYRREDGDGFYFCGHWNGSPVEIGVMARRVQQIPPRNAYHYHPYHEYYVVLAGKTELLLEGERVPLEAGTVVMVETGERHRLTWVDPVEGVWWIIVKAGSVPGSKHVVSEDKS